MFRVFEDATPLVEQLSIDEAFLDVRGMERLAGTPTEIAARLRRDVRGTSACRDLRPASRPDEFLAKVASRVAKPDGLLVVPPRRGARVPPPAARRWLAGRRAPFLAAKLHARGIRTVGEAARLPEEALVLMVGRAAGP